MEDIYALLNLNKGVLQNFHLQARYAIDNQTELDINRCVRTLKEIEERMMTDKSVSVPQKTIDAIMMKVVENVMKGNADMSIWSIRELRIISYYLMMLQGNEDAYQYALNLLDANWRDMFFNGLSFYCLNSWNMIEPNLRMLTCEFLIQKLQQYTGDNRKYMAMKNHANLFEEAGPQRLSFLLSQKKQELSEAPVYFGSKASTISQSYYSDVIISFFEMNRITDLGAVENILEIHSSDRTKKLLFADLVKRYDEISDRIMQSQLCKFANRILGDITLTSTWAPFTGATDSDAQKLRNAKQLVNLWFNQSIIETVFEVCAKDRERKEFWLKYANRVSSFIIVASPYMKKMIQSDSRLNGITIPFIQTSSYSSQSSALIMFIRNKMIVEFIDKEKGALYVYNHNHRMVDMVLKKKHLISNTADLKITSWYNLIDAPYGWRRSYSDEGRMVHSNNWQSRLTGWMNEKIINAKFEGFDFSEKDEDKIFKAQPIPQKEYKPSVKPVQDIPAASKSAQTENEAASSFISSKWIANDKCRIVCSNNGFYVYIVRGNQYIQLRPLLDNTGPTGSIWIKKANEEGWQQIIHATDGKELSVGFIKQAGWELRYKRELNQNIFMSISL